MGCRLSYEVPEAFLRLSFPPLENISRSRACALVCMRAIAWDAVVGIPYSTSQRSVSSTKASMILLRKTEEVGLGMPLVGKSLL
jgi:hypothetical protein